MKDNLPDFFIVGAAKSGTTSLYHYLEQHPSVFLPKNKEPKYFVSKIVEFPQEGKGDELACELMIKDITKYKQLFHQKGQGQICGEASVDYLYYSEKVIPLIKNEVGDSKIIIILRDPVKRAFAAYNHLIRDVRETETFDTGLELESERIKNNYEFIWHYKRTSLYYKDVKNYLDSFKSVKIIIFEEFLKEPILVTKEVYKFLGIDENFTPQVDKTYNFTGTPKNITLQKLLKGSSKQIVRRILKVIFNENTRKLIRENMEKMNISRNKIKILPETEQSLSVYFKEDRLKIEKLLKIKLDYWT